MEISTATGGSGVAMGGISGAGAGISGSDVTIELPQVTGGLESTEGQGSLVIKGNGASSSNVITFGGETGVNVSGGIGGPGVTELDLSGTQGALVINGASGAGMSASNANVVTIGGLNVDGTQGTTITGPGVVSTSTGGNVINGEIAGVSVSGGFGGLV